MKISPLPVISSSRIAQRRLSNENAKLDGLNVGRLDPKLNDSSSSTAVPQCSLIENYIEANDGRGGHLLPQSRTGSPLPQLQQPSLQVREGAFHPDDRALIRNSLHHFMPITLCQTLTIPLST